MNLFVQSGGSGATAPPLGQHAVVIGASISGLLAARVLTDYFARVTIVERDQLPTEPRARPGVPQARHAHIFLMRGQRILEELFPGIRAELTAAGAPQLNLTNDWAVFQSGAWAPRCVSPYESYTCSRDLLEATVRKRLRQSPKVRILERHDARHLVSTDDHRRVIGLKVHSRDDGQVYDLEAALVVDASGRASSAPQWLTDMGMAPPEETIINSFLGYATRWYHSLGRNNPDWQAVAINGIPPVEPRGGVLFPVEGNRWVVTLGGTAGVYPPTDEPGFLAFAQALPQSTIYDAIKDALPSSPIYGYRRTENRLRHYERLAHLPEGFILVGDAVCAFNPVYVQGMTVAAMGADVLGRTLRRYRQRHSGGDLTGLSKSFQRRLASVHTMPWLLATGADLSWPTTVGGHPRRLDRVMKHYVIRVLQLVAEDPYAYQLFVGVTHMLRPPATLFHPRIVLGIVRQALARRRRRRNATARG